MLLMSSKVCTASESALKTCSEHVHRFQGGLGLHSARLPIRFVDFLFCAYSGKSNQLPSAPKVQALTTTSKNINTTPGLTLTIHQV
jgi:hypothetical protein